jgi:hypothetical protein
MQRQALLFNWVSECYNVALVAVHMYQPYVAWVAPEGSLR